MISAFALLTLWLAQPCDTDAVCARMFGVEQDGSPIEFVQDRDVSQDSPYSQVAMPLY